MYDKFEDYLKIYKFRVNLQLFAEDEKTEEATPKRKEEARQKGQVAKSMDIPQVATLLVGMVVIAFMSKTFYNIIYSEFIRNLSYIKKGNITLEDLGELFISYSFDFFFYYRSYIYRSFIGWINI